LKDIVRIKDEMTKWWRWLMMMVNCERDDEMENGKREDEVEEKEEYEMIKLREDCSVLYQQFYNQLIKRFPSLKIDENEMVNEMKDDEMKEEEEESKKTEIEIKIDQPSQIEKNEVMVDDETDKKIEMVNGETDNQIIIKWEEKLSNDGRIYFISSLSHNLPSQNLSHNLPSSKSQWEIPFLNFYDEGGSLDDDGKLNEMRW